MFYYSLIGHKYTLISTFSILLTFHCCYLFNCCFQFDSNKLWRRQELNFLGPSPAFPLFLLSLSLRSPSHPMSFSVPPIPSVLFPFHSPFLPYPIPFPSHHILSPPFPHPSLSPSLLRSDTLNRHRRSGPDCVSGGAL